MFFSWNFFRPKKYFFEKTHFREKIRKFSKFLKDFDFSLSNFFSTKFFSRKNFIFFEDFFWQEKILFFDRIFFLSSSKFFGDSISEVSRPMWGSRKKFWALQTLKKSRKSSKNRVWSLGLSTSSQSAQNPIIFYWVRWLWAALAKKWLYKFSKKFRGVKYGYILRFSAGFYVLTNSAVFGRN